MRIVGFDENRKAVGSLLSGKIDCEIGDSESLNTFEAVGISDCRFWGAIGQEYGGVIEKTEENNELVKTGFTWRGLLQQWLIEPLSDNDYFVVSGDINIIVGNMVSNILGGFFTAVPGTIGVTVNNYQFLLHCTVLDGLMRLCEDNGCKLCIRNTVKDGCLQVEVFAEPAVPKTLPATAFSATVTVDGMGINHLICWGKGELKERLRKDIYLQPDGNVTYEQYYIGFAERQAVYENTSYESETEFVNYAIQRLSELASYTRMDITEIQADGADIGDVLTVKKGNYVVTAPVVRKILTWSGGVTAIETKMKGQG